MTNKTETEDLDLESVIDEATDRGFDESGEILAEGETPVVIEEGDGNEEAQADQAQTEEEGEKEGESEEGGKNKSQGEDEEGGEEQEEENKEDADDKEEAEKDTGEDEIDGEEDVSDEEFAKTITKERTRKRFEKLRSENQELDTKYSELDARYQNIQQSLSSTGCTPQEIGELLDIGEALKKGDFEKAIPMIQPMLDLIARETGKEFGSADPISEYPDLQEQVDDLVMTREDALTVANARSIKDAQRRQIEAQQAQQQEAAQMQAQHGDYQRRASIATKSVDDWATSAAGKDPDFQRYEAQIIKFLEHDIKSGTIQPEQYVQSAQQYYQQLRDFAGGIAKQDSPGLNTLRGNSDNRQRKQAPPTSIESAIDQAMNDMYANG